MKVLQILSAGAAMVIALSATQALAGGDPAKGEKLAKKKCGSCHTLDEGGANRLGPNLFGVLGRTAGTVEGFKFSKPMVASGLVWDGSSFTDFIEKPKKFMKGTKMGFRGLKKAAQRADLLAYFETLQAEGGEQAAHAGNVEDGRVAAQKYCAVCHSFEQGGKVVLGPNLFGIVGQPAASVVGFKYSEALTGSGLVWTDNNLIGFLADPEGFLPGTTARFPGLKTAKQKADILAYLKTFQ